MDKRTAPIAVFDSGMGGISVLKQLEKLMPNENYLYFGDSKNAPYGTKSTEKIKELTEKAVVYLLSKEAKAIVIACNTATSAAAEYLREKYTSVPIVGLEPALKPAALSSEHPTVVVMATPLTLREKKFALLTEKFRDRCEIINLPAPGLVELVEQDKIGTDEMTEYVESLFAPLDKAKIDCVVLGCTHFPFARKTIESVLGGNVRIYDGAEGEARQTKRLLEEADMLNPFEEKGKITFENSDETKIELLKKLFSVEI